jgi:hypothetical protein
VPKADVERRGDHVPDGDLVDGVTDLHDLAEVLVSEDAALLEVGAPLVHVQVRAADVRRRDADQDVGGLLDPGVGDVVDADLARPVVDECFHGRFLPFGRTESGEGSGADGGGRGELLDDRGAERGHVLRASAGREPAVTQTSSSTTSAPALRRSVRMLGHEVSRFPRTQSASASVHGPWQIDATGFPVSTNERTKTAPPARRRRWRGSRR